MRHVIYRSPALFGAVDGLAADELSARQAAARFAVSVSRLILSAYVDQLLARTLSLGDVVITHNLAGHKVAGVCSEKEARGASLL